VSYVNHVTPIPAGISSTEAASILCAGVTTYRALKYSGAQHGDWVVLPGAGGGLGHLAVQYARARGLRVIAVDSGAEKRKLCEELGAEVWVDFKETEDVVKAIRDATGGPGAHVALVTAATGAAYQQAIDYLRPGGTLMAVGLPGEAKLEASIFFTVFKVSRSLPEAPRARSRAVHRASASSARTSATARTRSRPSTSPRAARSRCTTSSTAFRRSKSTSR
jgi:propanol-preferring alcohol dehydrogenase